MNTSDLPPLALIAGPTASGKSALAMHLARTRPSVIINADSKQVYRDLRVITARPSEADEAEVPHRLFGHVDGARPYSAAEWAADAKAAIAEAHEGGRLPIVVGGTGLYIRTLLDGIAPVPVIDPVVRRAVRAMPVAQAHAELTHEDPAAAARLHPADTTRVSRALEVMRSTGVSLAAWQKRREGGIGPSVALRPLVLLPPRSWLNERIDRRFEAIFASDAAHGEAGRLRERRLPAELPVNGAIGLRSFEPAFLRDEGIEVAIATGQGDTRRYAKRQYTWFRHQVPEAWTVVNEAGLITDTRLFRDF